MQQDAQREKIWFDSGGTQCAAWHYPGTNGACVIMAGGFAVTKEPGTDLFATRFRDSGFSVLAFDYRHLGESGGQPRQVVRVREQTEDWSAAIGFAAGLPGVDPGRAILADHDRLSRSMQRPADELTEVTISPRHGSPPQPSLRCLDGQCLSCLTHHTATGVKTRLDAPREPPAAWPDGGRSWES